VTAIEAARPGACPQAVADAALLILERMGLTPADLLALPQDQPPAPTFAEYIPVVSALVSDGCRKAYGSYWNRVTGQWGFDARVSGVCPSWRSHRHHGALRHRRQPSPSPKAGTRPGRAVPSSTPSDRWCTVPLITLRGRTFALVVLLVRPAAAASSRPCLSSVVRACLPSRRE
jgi:hypothetical protein